MTTSTATSLTVTADGRRLRDLRRQQGLSQERLVYRSGISLTTIRRLEHQDRAPRRGRTLARLATTLGEDPAFMLASTPVGTAL